MPAVTPDHGKPSIVSPAPRVPAGASSRSPAACFLLLLPLAFTMIVVLGAWWLYHGLALDYAAKTNLRIPNAKDLPRLAPAIDLADPSLSKAQRDAARAVMAAAANRLAGRLTWVTLVIVFLTIALAAFPVTAYVLFQLLARNARCGLANCGATLLFLLVVLLGVPSFVVLTAIDYSPIHHSLLGPTLMALDLPHADVWQRRFDRAGQVAALGFAALASLILPSPTCTDPQCLRERTSYLNLVLAVGTALLVTDVMRADALLRWASTFIDPRSTAAVDIFRSLTVTIISMRGLFGTILLASIYLPASFLLRECVRAAAVAAVGTSSMPRVNAWLQEQGLVAPSALAQVRPILALLLPLLTGLLTGPAADVLRNLATR